MTPATIRRIAQQWASVLMTTIDTEFDWQLALIRPADSSSRPRPLHRRYNPILLEHHALRNKRARLRRRRHDEYLLARPQIATRCWGEGHDRHIGRHGYRLAATLVRELKVATAGAFDDGIYVRIRHRTVRTEIPR